MRFGITEYPDEGIRYYEHFERIFNNGKQSHNKEEVPLRIHYLFESLGKQWRHDIKNVCRNKCLERRLYPVTMNRRGQRKNGICDKYYEIRSTGKRNIAGMMNDASNSLTRMYLNTVKDFWRQATIDYVLGYHKIEIFRHVPQSTQMSAEPGVERRWAKMRQDASE